jgi:large subunit ribosomal protein L24
MKFRVGDDVIVMTGKDKGKTGNISKIFSKSGKVLVDGVNKQVKHRKGGQGKTGERVEIFAPIDSSNVQVLDPKSKKPTRIGYKILDSGQKIRIGKASGEELSVSTDKKEKKPVKTKSLIID